MSMHPLLCPRCQKLLFESAPNRIPGVCPACGWHGLPIHASTMPGQPFPAQKRSLQAGLGRLWLAGSGGLLSLAAPWQAWKTLPLPEEWRVNGLGFGSGVVIISPGEAHTLGVPKPLLALDLESGEMLWQFEGQGIKWTPPAVDETLVCAVDSRGQVALVRLRTGKPTGNIPSLENYPRRGIPPCLTRRAVLLTLPDGSLQAWSREGRRLLWHFHPAEEGLDFPPTPVDEKIAYLCAGAGLYALDLRNGQSRLCFRAPRRSSQGWYFAAPQVTPQGLLVVHADFDDNGGRAYALQLIEADTGLSLWKYPLHHRPDFAPACDHGRVAIPDRDGHLLILDLVSGEELASLDLGDEKPGSSPLWLEDNLFLLTEAGNLLRFSPDMRIEHLPAAPQDYLARGEWELAALKLALQGDLNNAASLYQAHGCLIEATALYEMAGNFMERDRLADCQRRQDVPDTVRAQMSQKDDDPIKLSGPCVINITNINTGGGTYVDGNVNIGGGNFVGRDKI